MSRYIGLDLGTTSITALLLDAESGETTIRTAANDAETTAPEDRAVGRSEWDMERMITRSTELLGALITEVKGSIHGIGVTGQQHGMVLLDRKGVPCTPFIGWQDRRCLETLDGSETYLDRMLKLGGSGFARSEYLPARGYMGSTLFWLSQNRRLPGGARAAFAPDYLVGRLCDRPPVTDPTNAAGSGLFDVIDRRWNTELLFSLGIPASTLPETRASCTWAGTLGKEAAERIGLPAGTPVTNACGDNQASFAGSVADYTDSALINIGTGGQISIFNPGSIRIEGLLVRPYLNDGFLLVGAGLTGGRAYGILERFIKQVGEQIFGLASVPEVYDRLNELAAAVPSGADGLRCEPIFTGSLREPRRRGVWSGVSDTNLTPGHLVRSLLEGMAEQFHLMYQAMQDAGVLPRNTLIGAGNGVRRNHLLSHLLSDTFHRPLHIVRHVEEAAFGAALCASVAAGEFADIEAAGRRCIRYDTHEE